MNETPNFYFSEEEVESILQNMEVATSEGQSGTESNTVFNKIFKVFPEATIGHEWLFNA